MKLLLDTCVSPKGLAECIAAGHDAQWVGSWSEDPGDESILRYAHQQQQILITLDKDFGELAIVHRLPHAGIVRLVDLSVKQQVPVCLHILKLYGELLQKGAIVTAQLDRVRIRPPESSEE